MLLLRFATFSSPTAPDTASCVWLTRLFPPACAPICGAAFQYFRPSASGCLQRDGLPVGWKSDGTSVNKECVSTWMPGIMGGVRGELGHVSVSRRKLLECAGSWSISRTLASIESVWKSAV